MKCRAAVLRGVGEDWEIREVELDPPRDGEVLVRMAVAGICHSDDHLVTGDVVPTPEVLAATGMPAAGLVPDARWSRGRWCRRRNRAGRDDGAARGSRGDVVHSRVRQLPVLCQRSELHLRCRREPVRAREMPTDGTCRRHLGDENLLAYGQLGTFAEYAVLTERSVIKIDDAIPFHAASLVSCGVSTGWGSATVSAGTEPGDTVVVIGTGGVGMNALQGARAAGATYVVAVDPVESKRDSAKIFGATHSRRLR